jgi:transcription initiation factor TFIIIB Brf1 subunit/transcription initiation factor TFIIB
MCPTCGDTQFEHNENDENAALTCASCGLQISRTDLIEANSESISAHVDQMKSQVVADVTAQLHKALRGFRTK